MSRYAVDKVLWQVARDGVAAEAYMASPSAFLAGRDLTADEHRQLIERDYAALFAAGAHPFLLYTFRIKVAGGWSFQLMLDHVAAICDIPPPGDIAT